MTYLQIAVLAVIQGAAELLPISSSAHVIVAERLMGFDPSSPELTFLLVMLHTGTMGAVLCYFWPRWRALWLRRSAGGAGPSPFHFPLMVLLATVCTGALGLALKLLIERLVMVRGLGYSKGEIEELFKNLPLMAVSLFTVGILIIAAGSVGPKTEAPSVSPRSSVLIGLVQALCVPFRGFSRSGATISTALFCGVSRRLAEDFSFALAVLLTPPAICWELLRLLREKKWPDGAALTDLLFPGLVGMALSFLAGLLALRLLSAALERGKWKYFGFYCLAASAAVACAALAGV